MRRQSVAFLSLLCWSAGWGYAQKKPVTIESITSERPSRGGGSVTWSPDGQRFLYVEDGKLTAYDLGTKQSKEILTLRTLSERAVKVPAEEAFSWQNRRVNGTAPQWFPSGDRILLESGGDLFIHSLTNGRTDSLTQTPVEEADAKISPDGKRIAFRRGHELFVADVASKQVTQLTHGSTATLWNGQLDWVYPEELDLGTAYWWSPDSGRIAYMQFDVSQEFLYPQTDLLGRRAKAEPERYPQAGTPNADVRVGVVAASGGETRWLDLGDTKNKLIARVNWTPDSRSVAVQVLNRVQNQLDLLLANVETGSSHAVLNERDKTWVNVSDELYFFRSSPEFLWSSERTGFRHLYVYSLDGKQQQQLTGGPFEVTEVNGIDEAKGEVYFTSTEASPLERQFYRVTLRGGTRTRLTREAGTHSVSLSPDFRRYLDTYSSLTQPPRKALYRNDGSEWAIFREADRRVLDEYDVLPTQLVEYRDRGGNLFYARLIQPKGFDPAKKYPAVVVVYGGPHAQSVRNMWARPDWEQVLAHRGFVIWQVDNRGSAGRGHAWESPLYRRFGAVELEDQRHGLEYLLSKGYVDPSRVGMYGWSYGGFMTLYSLTHAPQTFRAGIAGAPVTDWHNYDTIYTERYLGLPGENEEGYKLSSPVSAAADLQAKLMIVHNVEDDNVLFQNSMQMINALEKAGKLFDLSLYPQKSHGVSGPVRRQMLERMTAFFEAQLKQAP